MNEHEDGGKSEYAGFGLGFERLVQFCTGMHNIRDVIPFRAPRVYACRDRRRICCTVDRSIRVTYDIAYERRLLMITLTATEARKTLYSLLDDVADSTGPSDHW